MHRKTSWLVLGGLVLLLGMLGGCGSETEPVENDDDVHSIVVNRPTSIGNLRVFATNFQGDTFHLWAENSEGEDEGEDAQVGHKVTLFGETFEVLDIVADDDAADRDDGGDQTKAMIRLVE